MDFKVWLLVATATLATAFADPMITKEPQNQAKIIRKQKTAQKRHDNYQDMIVYVYLTPTQIKDIQSGKTVFEPQYTYYSEPSQNQYKQQEPSQSQYQLDQQSQQNQDVQKYRQDILSKYQSEQQQQNEELQNYLHEKGQKIQQEIENLEANSQAQLQLQGAKQFEKIQLPEPLSEFQGQSIHYYPQPQQQSYPQFAHQEPQAESIPHQPQESFINFAQQGLKKQQSQPGNYAQLYFYPSEEELNKYYIPKAQQPQINEQILLQQESSTKSNPIPVSQKFQLIPYEYNLQAQLEAQQSLENQWTAPDPFKIHQALKIASQQPSQGHKQISSAQIISEQFKDQAEHEHLQLAAHQLTADQFEVIRHHSEEVQELQNRAVQKINELQKASKEHEKRIIAQHKEAQRLDAELEHEEFKADAAKAEDKFFGSLRHEQKYQFKIEESYLPSPSQLETGFKPLYAHKINEEQPQYAPKYNEDKFAQELNESAQRNRLEKAKALAKAAAISNSPPVILHKEVKVTRPIEVVKHVPVPQPFYVPVPAPFEVKVPQPYPVPLEIIRHMPIPIVKIEKIEIEKPVPFEVEKRVPVTVTKNVYIPVDKPYFVERVVPLKIKKEILVEKVIHNPQKFTIVKHTYSH